VLRPWLAEDKGVSAGLAQCAVGINPDLYEPNKKPPIYERWEKYRKPKQRAETDPAELERIADAWLFAGGHHHHLGTRGNP